MLCLFTLQLCLSILSNQKYNISDYLKMIILEKRQIKNDLKRQCIVFLDWETNIFGFKCP